MENLLRDSLKRDLTIWVSKYLAGIMRKSGKHLILGVENTRIPEEYGYWNK